MQVGTNGDGCAGYYRGEGIWELKLRVFFFFFA